MPRSVYVAVRDSDCAWLPSTVARRYGLSKRSPSPTNAVAYASIQPALRAKGDRSARSLPERSGASSPAAPSRSSPPPSSAPLPAGGGPSAAAERGALATRADASARAAAEAMARIGETGSRPILEGAVDAHLGFGAEERELPAGGVDVVAAPSPDEARVSFVAQDLLEREDALHPRRTEGARGDRVHRDEVDLDGQTPQERSELLRFGRHVVAPRDQRVLDRDPPAAGQGVRPQPFHQLGERVLLVDRHEPGARRVVCGVQRNGEADVASEVAAEARDLGHETARRDRHPPRGEADPLGVGEEPKRACGRIVVVEGFAHPHVDD